MAGHAQRVLTIEPFSQAPDMVTEVYAAQLLSLVRTTSTCPKRSIDEIMNDPAVELHVQSLLGPRITSQVRSMPRSCRGLDFGSLLYWPE